MRNRSSLNNFLNRDRKTLYMVLSVLVLSVFTLTMAYAALSTTLEIVGNAEVTAASWDIYLDNVELNSQSATTIVPIITDKTTASFSTTLTNPGDFYEFTVDVVNNGSIDAMIDSITKTPTLTETQAKYLNYTVEYQNGEAISTKQLVSKNSFVRLKVRVEFRKDISASDLPTTSETLNLSFTVNYIQSDETGINVNNNGKIVKIISGDYDTVGSEVSIGDEHFYIISSDDTSVTMLAKYNLHVGNKYDDTNGVVALENQTGIQDSSAIGWFDGYSEEKPIIGTIAFSSTNYWYDGSALKSEYETGYVYDSNSNLYTPVENYKTYLENMGVTIEEARLIKQEELVSLGCDEMRCMCYSSSYAWTYSTSYWTGTFDESNYVWYVSSGSDFGGIKYSGDEELGVRPVIKIAKSAI